MPAFRPRRVIVEKESLEGDDGLGRRAEARLLAIILGEAPNPERLMQGLGKGRSIEVEA